MIGIFFSVILGNHIVFQSSNLIRAENAPIYDTKALANRESPITDLILIYKSLTFYLHLLFSPASPLTNFSAAFNLAIQALASASTKAF